MKKYYHIPCALAFISGFIICRFYIAHNQDPALSSGRINLHISFILGFLVLFAAAFFFRKKNKNHFFIILFILALLVFAFSGFLIYSGFSLKQANNFFESLNNAGYADKTNAIVLEGRISSHVRHYSHSASFTFDSYKIIIDPTSTEVSGNEDKARDFIILRERADIRIYPCKDIKLKRDDFLRIKCEIVKGSRSVYLQSSHENIKSIEPDSFMHKIYSIRQLFYSCISNIFYHSFPYEQASLCEAIILGNKNSLPMRIIEDFKKSGLYHLLAISGLHISFFIFIIHGAAGHISSSVLSSAKNKKLCDILIMVFLIFVLFAYNFIVGQKASIERATIMVMFSHLSRGLKREHDIRHILSFSFIILLYANPGFFNDAGFWLSFASMFSILYIKEPLSKILEDIKSKALKKLFYSAPAGRADLTGKYAGRTPYSFIGNMALTTFSINIFIFPVLARLFGQFTLLGLVSNIAAIPLFYAVLFILFISSATGIFWPQLALMIIRPAGPVMALFLRVSRLWKNFEEGVLEIKSLSIIHMVLYYLLLGIVMFFLYKYTVEKRKIINNG